MNEVEQSPENPVSGRPDEAERSLGKTANRSSNRSGATSSEAGLRVGGSEAGSRRGGTVTGRSHEAEPRRAKPAFGLVERSGAKRKEDGHRPLSRSRATSSEAGFRVGGTKRGEAEGGRSSAGRTRPCLYRGMQAEHRRFARRTVAMARASSRGSGLLENAAAASIWRQRRVGRAGLGNVSASAGAGTGSGRVAEVRRWLGSICAALCPRGQATAINGGSSPALECPITRAPDGVVCREGGRLAGRTNGRWCHESVVRAHVERCDGRGRTETAGAARCRWKPDGRTQRAGRHFRSGASGAGTHRIVVGPTGSSGTDVARLRAAAETGALRPTCGATS
jgi:hypothetical protein